MTQYYFNGQKISHLDFISLCHHSGIAARDNESLYAAVQRHAANGIKRAITIANSITVDEQ